MAGFMNQIVMTASQGRENSRAGAPPPINWKGKGSPMWWLRQEKPQLFEQTDKDTVTQKTAADRPQGFEPCQMDGWLYNKDKNIYWNLASRSKFWYDEAQKVHKPLHEGESFPCTFSGGAAAVPALSDAAAGSSAPAAACRGKATAAASTTAKAVPALSDAPKHVVISDLHAVAKALKKDFGHLDKPAGALAIVGPSPPGSSVSTDVVARAVPEKLLRRLSAFRSEWSDEDLCAALEGSISDVAAGDGGIWPNVAIALVVGTRVVAAASPGTHVGLCTHSSSAGDDPQSIAVCSPDKGDSVATICRHLGEDDVDTLTVSLAVGAAFSNFTASAPHLVRGRARAASITHLRYMRDEGAKCPLGVACARLALQTAAAGSEGAAASSGPPAAKRQKTEEVSKIRVRQILLRHAGVAKPTDREGTKPPVRNKRAAGTLEEVEEQMLGLLVDLAANGCSSFASVCKAQSECPSSLKGGEMAGDMGWLDRTTADKEGQKMLKLRLPPNVLKGAFELSVGELGDIVTSEQGVHLVQRTA